MTKDIFQAVNPSYIQKLFKRKKNTYFPSFKKYKIKDIKIEKVSPDWAKETCLVKYVVFFNNNKKKILRGTAKKLKSKKPVWEVMSYLNKKVFLKGNLQIAKPIDFLKDINLLIYEEASGTPLAEIIEKENLSVVKKNLKKTALWLTKLHNATPKKENLPKALFLKKKGYVEIMKVAKDLLPRVKNFLIPPNKLNFVDKIWYFKKTVIHNDLYSGNIIINPKYFFVIDFDRFGFGPPLMDVATIYGSLEFPKEVWPNKLNSKNIKDLQKLLLTTYCKLNKLNYQETLKEIKPFLSKIFLDQIHYYTAFTAKGWKFMNKKEKAAYTNKIKKLLLKAKEYLPN